MGRCVHKRVGQTKTRSPSSALLPFFGWEGSPTKTDCRKKGTLILTSLLEDLDDTMEVSFGE